jgi:hypothetical protein
LEIKNNAVRLLCSEVRRWAWVDAHKERGQAALQRGQAVGACERSGERGKARVTGVLAHAEVGLVVSSGAGAGGSLR